MSPIHANSGRAAVKVEVGMGDVNLPIFDCFNTDQTARLQVSGRWHKQCCRNLTARVAMSQFQIYGACSTATPLSGRFRVRERERDYNAFASQQV